KEIILVLRPLGAGEIKNCARVQFEHGQCVCTRVGRAGPTIRGAQADIGFVKQGPQRARLNESLTYRLTVTNPASRELTGVKVTDALPAGLVHSSGKRTLSWDLKSIPAGQSVTVEYQVVAKKEGRLCNKAEVRAEGGLREEATSCVMVGDARMTLAKTGPKV